MHSESLDDQVATLRQEGLVVVRNMLDAGQVAELRRLAQADLDARVEPLELEADLGYPGAPSSQADEGGGTVRRLLDAWSRNEAYRTWATGAPIREWMQAYFNEPACLSLAHHNCVMTKHPAFGTATGWHRDIRYWSFPRNELISVWLALGAETPENGALKFIPGSHRLTLQAEQMDELDFLRPEVPANQALFAQGIALSLEPGDVVLFHSGLFHAAGRNDSDQVKCSAVFAYHGKSNPPLPGTRSAASEDVTLDD